MAERRHFLYSLKASENLSFSDIFRDYRKWRLSDVFIVNFEHISDFEQKNVSRISMNWILPSEL